MKCKIKKSWIDTELEHSHLFKSKDKRKSAKNIVEDHIKEYGCNYYPSLYKMKKKLMKGGK